MGNNNSSYSTFLPNGYTYLFTINENKIGKVVKAQLKGKNKKTVAIRILKKTDDTEQDLKIGKEIEVYVQKWKHMNLKNKYTLEYYNYHSDLNNFYQAIEYCPGGNLKQFVNRKIDLNENIDEDLIWKYLIEICLCLKKFHDNGLCHGDIKPNNIYLTQDQANIGTLGIKVDSLISLKIKDGYLKTNAEIEDKIFNSPEIQKGELYQNETDIWCLGCVIYFLCCKKYPFIHKGLNSVNSMVLKGEYNKHDIPMEYSQHLKTIINDCLHLDKTRRNNVMQIQDKDMTKDLAEFWGVDKYSSQFIINDNAEMECLQNSKAKEGRFTIGKGNSSLEQPDQKESCGFDFEDHQPNKEYLGKVKQSQKSDCSKAYKGVGIGLYQKADDSGIQKIVSDFSKDKPGNDMFSNIKMCPGTESIMIDGPKPQTLESGSEYFGDIIDEKANGYGTCKFLNQDVYKGFWKNNQMNGKGVKTFSNGSLYDGNFLNDKFDGYGKFTNKTDNTFYNGYWKGGKKIGNGFFRYSDDSMYYGNWENDKKHGQGKHHLRNGDKYIGEFFNGSKHGNKGIYYFKDGRKYDGQWKFDKAHGYGEYFWPDGVCYKGQWDHGKKNGHGVFYDKDDKAVYDGQWLNDKRHGKGKQVQEDNECFIQPADDD